MCENGYENTIWQYIKEVILTLIAPEWPSISVHHKNTTTLKFQLSTPTQYWPVMTSIDHFKEYWPGRL